MVLGVIFYSLPLVAAIGLLVIWSACLTRAVTGRVRSAHGAGTKTRYALPALLAWCWPLVLVAELAAINAGARMPVLLELTLPFAAPLLGAFLAEYDRTAPGQG